MERRLVGIPLTVRALDLTITDLRARVSPERDEQLELLQNLRSELLAGADEPAAPSS